MTQKISEMMSFKKLISLLLLVTIFFSCSKDDIEQSIDLSIFVVNDVHGQLYNFAKLKPLIDEANADREVLILSAGDMFSGNPVVDNHPEKGYPMIDLMNEIGTDVAVLGNHEFDYGEEALSKRIAQSDFPWICANIDASNSVIHQPPAYVILDIGTLKIVVIGFIETEGKPGEYIPLTHPWKVQNLSFSPFQETIGDYSNIKETENADFVIGLNHLGHYLDVSIAKNYSYFDLIFSGHSHAMIDTYINNTLVVQAGGYLNYAGRVDINYFKETGEYEVLDVELIDLNAASAIDQELLQLIDQYENNSGLDDVIGYSGIHHQRNYNVGCFYTDALRSVMHVDVTVQNYGGVRNDLDEGDITKREIYAISPFNNGTVIYQMTIAELKDLFYNVTQGLYYAGIEIEMEGNQLMIKDTDGKEYSNEQLITLGINDYIPAVYEDLFPEEKSVQDLSAAETLINYLESNPGEIRYESCNRFFKP